MATGMSGKANMPSFAGMDSGRSTSLFKAPWSDKYKAKGYRWVEQLRAISQPRCGRTMLTSPLVQRSSTHIVRSDTLMEIALSLYSERAVKTGMTTEKADLIFTSLPTRSCTNSDPLCGNEGAGQEFYDGLEKADFGLIGAMTTLVCS